MIGSILLVFAFVFACIAALFAERFERAPFGLHFGWLAVVFWIASILAGSKLF